MKCYKSSRFSYLPSFTGGIVGSAIIKILEKHGTEAPKYVGEYVKEMKDAIR